MRQMILCVDDEKIVLETLKEQLKDVVDEHCVIEIADSGADAINIIEEYAANDYQILMVISDYIMPGMKGDELLTRIHKEHPETVNILLTGQATLEGISTIINHASLFRFIQKPWFKEDLALSVNEGIKSYEKDQIIQYQNKLLRTQNDELLHWSNSVVESLGKALDSRDTTTSGHSKRMANYAVQLARAVNASNLPAFKDKTFMDQDIEVIYYAALLHDIGKIGVREHILLKSAKLSADRLQIIEQRIHLFIKCLETTPVKSPSGQWLLNNYQSIIEQLHKISCSGAISTSGKALLEEMKNLTFVNVENQSVPILEDDEYEALSVEFGNLTPQERIMMESHAKWTHDILKDIPWPEHLADVPFIASSHHERLDGSGYYLGLSGDELSLSTRIVAILDVYEALTSPNRPYRSQVSEEQALRILVEDAKSGKFDVELVDLFAEMMRSDWRGSHE